MGRPHPPTIRLPFYGERRRLVPCSLVGGDYVACLCSTTLSFSVCVILNGSLRVFFFKLILFCKVRCHVAESYYSGDRWCYDWTKSDSLFRILIGTCGSHKTLVHGAVLCDYIFMFPFSLFFAFLILCSEAYDDCSSFSWNYRLNFILMSIWLAVCLRLHW